MKELVVYHNDINKIPLRNFSEKEINIFFSLLFKLKNKEDNKVEISFKELKKISNGDIHSDRFLKSIKNLSKKLLTIHIEEVLENKDISIFNIFSEFVISTQRKEVSIQINDRFKYMLNSLFKHFTKFELEQLVGFKSSYSKNIFRLLKQYESTKFFTMNLEEFKRILCIPQGYKMCDIDKWVFKPAMKELNPLFQNLKLEKIKKGRKIEKVQFKWEADQNGCLIENKVKISKNLSDYIEILKKKNRYIAPYLTPANIEILLKVWKEDKLIKGLKFAKSQIQKEFTSLNYLKKAIKTGIEASEKFFAIEENEKEEESKIEKKSIVSKPKAEVDPLIDIKGEIAKWCMKEQKYSLVEELAKLNTLMSISEFIGKHSIEIVEVEK